MTVCQFENKMAKFLPPQKTVLLVPKKILTRRTCAYLWISLPKPPLPKPLWLQTLTASVDEHKFTLHLAYIALPPTYLYITPPYIAVHSPPSYPLYPLVMRCASLPPHTLPSCRCPPPPPTHTHTLRLHGRPTGPPLVPLAPAPPGLLCLHGRGCAWAAAGRAAPLHASKLGVVLAKDDVVCSGGLKEVQVPSGSSRGSSRGGCSSSACRG